MNIRHICIATDLSDASLRPFGPMAELARGNGATITLLSVVQDFRVAPHGAPLAPPFSGENLGREAKAAREGLARLREHLPEDVEVRTDVATHESIAKGIANYAGQHDVDLLAISTHGRTGFRHLILGSVAEEVLRHADVPVLCFPRSAGSEA